MSEEPPPQASNSLLSRLHQALHIAMKHYRCDRDCGSSYVASDGSRGCGCGKVQDRFRISALFTDDESKSIHSGRAPDEPPVVPYSKAHVGRFGSWLEKEMPAGTVIGDPRWWASKLLCAACATANAWPAPPPAAPTPAYPPLDDPHYGNLTGEALARRAGFASVRDLLSGYKTLVRERASQPPKARLAVYPVTFEVMDEIYETLKFYANPCSYQGERTGGVLAGCPRGPEPTPDQLVAHAQAALRRIDAEVLGRAPETKTAVPCPGQWHECPRTGCQSQMRCVHGPSAETGESRDG